MPKTGLWLIAAGALVFGTGMVLLVWLIFGLVSAHEAYSQPGQLGMDHVSRPIAVNPAGLCRVAVRMRIETDETEQLGTRMYADDEYRMEYAFPIHYEVTTADGEPIVDRDDVIDGLNEVLTGRKVRPGANGGVSHWRHGLASFALPDGTDAIRVTARVDPDTTHGASSSQLEFIVLDGVRPILARLLTCIGCAVVGILLMVVGAIVVVRGDRSGHPTFRETADHDFGDESATR